jgi:hypothetical protein
MDVPEQWGHRADAVVACLMGACALALTMCGLWVTYRCQQVMPFLLLFFVAEIAWWAWITHSLWNRWHAGRFSAAAWHVAIALPMACVVLTSVLTQAPQSQVCQCSPWLADRLTQQMILSLEWWLHRL